MTIFALVVVATLLAYFLFFSPFSTDEDRSTSKQTPPPQGNSFSKTEPKKESTPKDNNDSFVMDNKQLDETLKKTDIPKLNIKLHSVFLGKEKKSGYALISYNGAPQQIYMLNSSLSEGVLLKSLSKNQVTIDNHGKLEVYHAEIEEDDANNTPPPVKQSPPPMQSIPSEGPGTATTPPTPPEPKKNDTPPIPSPPDDMNGNGPWLE